MFQWEGCFYALSRQSVMSRSIDLAWNERDTYSEKRIALGSGYPARASASNGCCSCYGCWSCRCRARGDETPFRHRAGCKCAASRMHSQLWDNVLILEIRGCTSKVGLRSQTEGEGSSPSIRSNSRVDFAIRLAAVALALVVASVVTGRALFG
jgi:hypothetical protein